MFAKLLKALDNRRPVTIDYTKADGTTSRRTIEAYDVRITSAGDIVIKAFDTMRNEDRTFRLDRVRSLRVLRGRMSFVTQARRVSVADIVEREMEEA